MRDGAALALACPAVLGAGGGVRRPGPCLHCRGGAPRRSLASCRPACPRSPGVATSRRPTPPRKGLLPGGPACVRWPWFIRVSIPRPPSWAQVSLVGTCVLSALCRYPGCLRCPVPVIPTKPPAGRQPPPCSCLRNVAVTPGSAVCVLSASLAHLVRSWGPTWMGERVGFVSVCLTRVPGGVCWLHWGPRVCPPVCEDALDDSFDVPPHASLLSRPRPRSG